MDWPISSWESRIDLVSTEAQGVALDVYAVVEQVMRDVERRKSLRRESTRGAVLAKPGDEPSAAPESCVVATASNQ